MWCAAANVIQYFAVAPREGHVSKNAGIEHNVEKSVDALQRNDYDL